jgi:hypothetical protein
LVSEAFQLVNAVGNHTIIKTPDFALMAKLIKKAPEGAFFASR